MYILNVLHKILYSHCSQETTWTRWLKMTLIEGMNNLLEKKIYIICRFSLTWLWGIIMIVKNVKSFPPHVPCLTCVWWTQDDNMETCWFLKFVCTDVIVCKYTFCVNFKLVSQCKLTQHRTNWNWNSKQWLGFQCTDFRQHSWKYWNTCNNFSKCTTCAV